VVKLVVPAQGGDEVDGIRVYGATFWGYGILKRPVAEELRVQPGIPCTVDILKKITVQIGGNREAFVLGLNRNFTHTDTPYLINR